MARPPNLLTFEAFLQYYMNLYYIMRAENPGIVHNEAKHLRKIEVIQNEYHKQLRTRYPDWDTEDNKGALTKHIDYLTKVFTNQKEGAGKKDKLQLLRDKLKR